MRRVIGYVDGYNLYYGLRQNGWKRYYWMDVQKLVRELLRPDQQLVETKYFTTIVEHPKDKNRRQAAFLDALRTLSDFKIYYGHFLSDVITCARCGYGHDTHHEKMTDVNIAVEMMTDAFQDRFDVALLVSADSDLVAPIRAIRNLFKLKRVVVAFPPAKYSDALKRAAGRPVHIDQNICAKSQFPDPVLNPDGFRISRPEQWR